MHRTYEPIKMFTPETLLKQKKLDPPSMSDTEITEAICQLAAEARPYASFEYYVQIIGAIRFLAQALTVGECGEASENETPKVPLTGTE